MRPFVRIGRWWNVSIPSELPGRLLLVAQLAAGSLPLHYVPVRLPVGRLSSDWALVCECPWRHGRHFAHSRGHRHGLFYHGANLLLLLLLCCQSVVLLYGLHEAQEYLLFLHHLHRVHAERCHQLKGVSLAVKRSTLHVLQSKVNRQTLSATAMACLTKL